MTLDSMIGTLRGVLLAQAQTQHPIDELLLDVMLTAVRDNISSNAPSWRHGSGDEFLKSDQLDNVCVLLGLNADWTRARIAKFSVLFLENVHERERLFGPNSRRYRR